MINIENISDEEKLEYLNKLLKNDSNFYKEFERYFSFKNKETNDKNEALDSLVKEIYDVFNDMDTELFMDDYKYSYGRYYDFYDYGIAEELCDVLFVEIKKRINNCIKQQDFYQGLFVLFATSKAIDLSPSLDDPYGFIYDYEDLLVDYYFSLVRKYIENLEKHKLSQNDSKKYILFLLNNSKNPDELVRLEEIFELLISTKNIAEFLVPFINKLHINMKLKVLHLIEDDTTFIQVAKEFYQNDNFVAKQLLSKLDELSKYQEYENIAKECFEKDNKYFVSSISKVITYDKSKEFYLELLKYKVLNHQVLEDYIEYKKYLNHQDIEDIQDKLCIRLNNNYSIKVLEYEKRYDKILNLIKNNNYFDLESAINTIKSHYPKECLDIIIDKCNIKLKEPNKNRDSYKYMCRLLKIINDLEDVKDDVDLYINKLSKRKPRLPALLDELKKAGLL